MCRFEAPHNLTSCGTTMRVPSLALKSLRCRTYRVGLSPKIAAFNMLLASVGFSNSRSRWSCHAINQLADVGYFTALQLRGKNTAKSIEGFLASSRRSFPQLVVWCLKAGISLASYFESRISARLPGSGAHLYGRKNGRSPAQ